MRSLFATAMILLLALSPLMGCDNSSTRDDDQPRQVQGEESEVQAEEDEVQAAEGGDAAALRNPAQATEQAPDQYRARFETTKGEFTIEVNRDWAPHGADRLYNLIRIGYFDDVAFFRVVEDFMVQFGIHGDPDVSAAWREADIPDDPVARSNKRGKVTFATRGPNTRTTQIFINFSDNTFLDNQGFSPVGQVVEGMDVVDSLYSGYGEGAPRGRGPDQGRIQYEGNEYLRSDFENLDFTTRAFIIEE